MPAAPSALKVFVSSVASGEDEALWQKLEKQLAILCRQGLIEIWDKADITAGGTATQSGLVANSGVGRTMGCTDPNFMLCSPSADRNRPIATGSARIPSRHPRS